MSLLILQAGVAIWQRAVVCQFLFLLAEDLSIFVVGYLSVADTPNNTLN
jgi:hypothetical protein